MKISKILKNAFCTNEREEDIRQKYFDLLERIMKSSNLININVHLCLTKITIFSFLKNVRNNSF